MPQTRFKFITGTPRGGGPITRALLAVNPKSRRGSENLAGTLAELERNCSLQTIPANMDLADAIVRLGPTVDCVIIGGGDGTLHYAAKALVTVKKPLGILPLGTANDLAHSLGIPRDIDKAVQVIVGGARRWVDVGEVNGRYFFNVAHIGLGADVTKRASRDRKRFWGWLAYPRAGLGALRHNRPFRATIRTGLEEHRTACIEIAVGNGRYYGGGMVIAPGATLDDQQLHCNAIPATNLWRFMSVAVRLYKGTQWNDARVITMAAAEIFIQTDRQMAVLADGEPSGSTPAHFRVVPRALEVLVP